jgi:DNA polymerase
MPIFFRDYETRSTLELGDVGAWRYTTHISTDVWCCAYCVDDSPVELWLPGNPIPDQFIEAANNRDWLIVAFNDGFERLVEQHIMAPRYGWPLIPIERHRCLQAASLARALPGSLDGAAAALKLTQQKDAAGKRVMMMMSRPRKPRRDEDPKGVYWFDDEERRQQLYAYCKQDVITERQLHKHVPFLEGDEQALWLIDQQINDRGVFVDRQLLDSALKIAEQAQADIDLELAEITAGEIDSVHQVARLLEWLNVRGCKLKSITKEDLERALVKELPDTTRRVIQLRLDGAHAATNKLDTMRAWLSPDSRARGCFKFHGASTGRWSSYGIQVQNLKRPVVEDVDAAIEAVASGSLQHLRQHYSQPMSVVGDVTRAMMCAAPGHRLIVADLSGIESRVTAWVSGQQSKLDMWRRFDETQDPTLEPYFLIGHMLGVPEEKARAIGKTADLAFGYMGGVGAWRKLAGSDDNSSEEVIKQRQYKWRDAHPHTRDFWKTINTKAINAVKTPFRLIKFQRPEWHHISFESDGMFLYMHLPSGRKIAYPFPHLTTTDRGGEAVVFMDWGVRGWGECRFGLGAYGGTWIENAVQAIARDIIADAMPRLEKAGYKIVLHVHDEIVAEVPEDFGSNDEFLKILTTPPAWAAGLPLAAKCREGLRFCKSQSKPIEREPIPEAVPEPESQEEPPPSENQEREERAFNGYASGGRMFGSTVGEYVYLDKDRNPYLKVRRTSEKQFPQFHWENGRWIKGAPKGPRIPFMLPELLAAPATEPVWIAEGEKDTLSVSALGLIATTNSGGAGKWAPELNRWLAGKQCAYVLEDNDDAGRAHARKVVDALQGIVPELRIVSFAELPEKGDVSDWLEQGHTKQELIDRAQAAPKFEIPPLPFINMSNWDHEEPPPREWIVHDRIPRYQTTLFSGEGAAGKSTVQLQLSFALTLGREWLLTEPEPGPAVYLDAEDDKHELHRRGARILEYYGATWGEAISGGLHLMSFAGLDAVLVTANRNGRIEPTPLYQQLLQAAGDIKPKMIGIASAANVFAGNENDRSHVQQFISLLTRLGITAGGAVQLISHPSLTGISTETGLSGNTQWHNAVRARCYLKGIKPEDGEQPDSDLRELVFKKNNYGSESIILRWQNGLFLPVPGAASLDQAAREELAEEIFLALLKRFTAQNRIVGHKNSVNYAPAQFAREEEAVQVRLSRRDLEAAMRRLFSANKIFNEPYGKPSRQHYRIALKEGA